MRLRLAKDFVARNVFYAVTVACCLIIVPLAVLLLAKALPILRERPVSEILFSSTWMPGQGKFGLLGFLAGTVLVTALAMLLAVPVSILTAIYLSEYAPRALRALILPLVDLLSGIPAASVRA